MNLDLEKFQRDSSLRVSDLEDRSDEKGGKRRPKSEREKEVDLKRRMMKEYVNLLRHLLAKERIMLRPKIHNTLEDKLLTLTNNLHEQFKYLHSCLGEKEKQFVDDIKKLKLDHISKVEKDIAKREADGVIIGAALVEADTLIHQKHPDLLLSSRVDKALKTLLGQEKEKKHKMNLKERVDTFGKHNVHYYHGVFRAIDRLRVGPPIDPEKSMRKFYPLMEVKRTPRLKLSLLSFSTASRESYRHMAGKWKKYANDSGEISSLEALQGIVKEVSADLENSQKGAVYAHDYTDKLFTNYSGATEEEQIPLRSAVAVIIQDTFVKIHNNQTEILRQLHQRLGHVVITDGNSLHTHPYRRHEFRGEVKSIDKETLCAAWAMWIEKEVEHALVDYVDGLVTDDMGNQHEWIEEEDETSPGYGVRWVSWS